jgi:uncharacterized Rmd1/YagE family protein
MNAGVKKIVNTNNIINTRYKGMNIVFRSFGVIVLFNRNESRITNSNNKIPITFTNMKRNKELL